MKSFARKAVDLTTHAFVLLLAVFLLQAAKMDVAEGKTYQAFFPLILTVSLVWLQAGMIKDWVEDYVKERRDQ